MSSSFMSLSLIQPLFLNRCRRLRSYLPSQAGHFRVTVFLAVFSILLRFRLLPWGTRLVGCCILVVILL
jgi:hypothetical protein